ncbi:MAG: hypothetical protein HY904_21960 [Deltaproteobacteria bacterium]|nr:hypothetical protein [Deltaproteobacteria bacterium]
MQGFLVAGLLAWVWVVPGAPPARGKAPRERPAAGGQGGKAQEPVPALATPVRKVRTAARTPSAAEIPQMLQQAQQACESFDLDRCVELGLALLGAPELQSEQQAAVYTHLAGSYAVMGDPTESERYYRLLLRLKPDFDLPAETPPKILVVFRNVQAEEQRIRDAMKEAEKKRLREGIALEVKAPKRTVGGQPLVIAALVSSKQGGVESVALRFRKDPAEQFATLPMVKAGKARYEATFPAVQTAGEQVRKWEYFVTVHGEGSETLKAEGSPEAPLAVELSAGAVPSPPLWRQPRLWVAVAVPAVSALTAAGVLTAAGLGGSVAAVWLYSIQPPRGALGTQRL